MSRPGERLLGVLSGVQREEGRAGLVFLQLQEQREVLLPCIVLGVFELQRRKLQYVSLSGRWFVVGCGSQVRPPFGRPDSA